MAKKAPGGAIPEDITALSFEDALTELDKIVGELESGKVKLNATPEAARIMLEAIAGSARPVGLKPAGGIRTVGDAGEYLALAHRIMGPGWATPERFRLGASGVLDLILATPDGETAPPSGTAY